ncbi:MAG: aspartyl-phosphate phosphatase Spo0E family protein [Clostridium sp.]|uniref:aspartyl-phosphate phosphatase Spo0E family protein n=1 Tax=Clostridium sp. TaxID=1506 RepID=UPI0025C73766|nr:aspartyl-phosphate phosphatase Spo0E family protein [Clostridium sp.]MCE5222035.1 aspartyl-phosphate phosphatase Spo0E family protein [Clostridium sp.]
MDKNRKIEDLRMDNDRKIEELREQLNKMICENVNSETILKLSQELDIYIVEAMKNCK